MTCRQILNMPSINKVTCLLYCINKGLSIFNTQEASTILKTAVKIYSNSFGSQRNTASNITNSSKQIHSLNMIVKRLSMVFLSYLGFRFWIYTLGSGYSGILLVAFLNSWMETYFEKVIWRSEEFLSEERYRGAQSPNPSLFGRTARCTSSPCLFPPSDVSVPIDSTFKLIICSSYHSISWCIKLKNCQGNSQVCGFGV
jgi:hypothetical protein